MGILEQSKKLLEDFSDTLADVELRKNALELVSPHRVAELDSEIILIEKKIKKLHYEIDEELSELSLTKRKRYFDSSRNDSKIREYNGLLVELDQLKMARRIEIEGFSTKS